MHLNVWIWDPGSGKNLFRIPDPGGQKGPESRIRIRNTKFTFVTTNSVMEVSTTWKLGFKTSFPVEKSLFPDLWGESPSIVISSE